MNPIVRIKYYAQKVVRQIWQKNDEEYVERIANELEAFDENENVHDLPEIFHYWSNKYLRPKLEVFGLTDPEQFFFTYSLRQCEGSNRSVRIVSIGAGNCDMEAQMAQRLVEAGQRKFRIDCIDINDSMLQRGVEHAQNMGVGKYVQPQKGDFNRWQPTNHYDVVIANQSLHHVVELESLFSAINRCLTPTGVFLTSDMIGRNGHQRWPEALTAMQPFWEELPDSYRYNRLLKRQEDTYINHDCSTSGFEGIRAQDILPLLVKNFYFELFIPFANIVGVFLDRPFGHNYDASGDWDRGFIDRVHACDEAGILSGAWKPTQMLSVLRTSPIETQLIDSRLTPEFCIRSAI